MITSTAGASLLLKTIFSQYAGLQRQASLGVVRHRYAALALMPNNSSFSPLMPDGT
jgi:hypothetical protein